MAKKPLSFEEALARLETLVDEIEQGKIGLEDSIARAEEGMALHKHCRDLLSTAELRISKLQNADAAMPTGSDGAAPAADTPGLNPDGIPNADRSVLGLPP